jgi:molybdate transport system substrate-binding protein
MREGIRAALALAAILFPPAAGAEELLVACAVSLAQPAERLAERFDRAHPGSRVRLSFGASSVLAAQIRAGAPLDVFLSADARIVEALAREGRVTPGVEIARNALSVLAVPERVSALRRPEDLLDGSVARIAIPNRSVPLGRYARQWLEARGLARLLQGRVLLTEHARATLAAVDRGHADVAIVYATDARLARRARPAFAIPESEQPHIVYVAAEVAASGGARAAAAFVGFLRSGVARRVLVDAGFAPPDGPAGS